MMFKIIDSRESEIIKKVNEVSTPNNDIRYYDLFRKNDQSNNQKKDNNNTQTEFDDMLHEEIQKIKKK